MKYVNFSSGPSALFPEVIAKIAQDIGNWNDTHCNAFEVSHRGPEFMELYRQMLTDLRKLLNIPDNYTILFLQGGARGQFAGVPLNLPNKSGKALYLNSAHWSETAAKVGAKYREVTSMRLTDAAGNLVKTDWTAESEGMDFVHYCSNETVHGIEIADYLTVAPGVPVVCDMSSNILSRPIDVTKFDVIYAGAQKNIGASGCTLVIVKKELVGHAHPLCPDVFDWAVQEANDSMINTPSTFAWYTCALTFKHLLEKFGDLATIEQRNIAKAELLYSYLDQSSFYNCKIVPATRSRMNVVFTTPSEELDALFVQQANQAGLKYLKGHKVVGGLRASIYNAISLEDVQLLVDFLAAFEKANS